VLRYKLRCLKSEDLAMKNREKEITAHFETISNKTYKQEFIPIINLKKIIHYSDKNLLEFRQLVLNKLKEVEKDYWLLKSALLRSIRNEADEKGTTFKLSEDAADILSKEQIAQLAVRQQKFIEHLKNILTRIENKTFSIWRIPGKLFTGKKEEEIMRYTLNQILLQSRLN
jgi:DnaK suppressor protein